MKKVLLFVLIFSMLISTNTFAAEENKKEKKEKIEETYSKMLDMSTFEITSEMGKMNIEELNMIIDEAHKQSMNMKNTSLNAYDTNSRVTFYNPVQIAWIAAAQIAIEVGYDCSGTLVKYSVRGDDFRQVGSGNFVEKIKSSSDYIAYMNSGSSENSFIFNEGDLFYALHKVSITTHAGYPYYSSYIHDTFDFEFDTSMGNLFATIVNDWGWLCQQTHVLNPIEVNILIYN